MRACMNIIDMTYVLKIIIGTKPCGQRAANVDRSKRVEDISDGSTWHHTHSRKTKELRSLAHTAIYIAKNYTRMPQNILSRVIKKDRTVEIKI